MPLKPVDSNLLYKSNNVHIYQTSTLGEKEYFRPATYAVVTLAWWYFKIHDHSESYIQIDLFIGTRVIL